MDFTNHRLNYNTVSDSDNLNNTNTVSVSDKHKRADLIAEKIVKALNNPSRKALYCKVAYALSEAQIWRNLELALEKGRNPILYFTWLCQRDMQINLKEKE